MNCPQWGVLQAYIDGEIEREERKQIALHLEQCGVCRQALGELKRLEEWEQVAFEESFPPIPEQTRIDVDAAWERFTQSTLNQKASAKFHHLSTNPSQETPNPRTINQRSWFHMAKPYTKWASAAAAVAILAGSLAIPSVQVAASNFLSIFRVDKTEMIKLTNEDLQEMNQWLAQGGDGSKELAGLGKMKAKGHRQASYSSQKAAAKAGIAVPHAPKGYTLSQVEHDTDWTLTFELDTTKTNKFLKKLNSDVQFDDSLNGKEFSIVIPEVVRTSFEQKDEHDSVSSELIFTSSKSPSIQAPADVDLDELRETVLRLPFIPDNVKSQLSKIEDWKATLPIPYIEGKGKEVTIDGVKGVFASDDHRAFMIWQKDGHLYQAEAWNTAEQAQPINFAEMKQLISQVNP